MAATGVAATGHSQAPCAPAYGYFEGKGRWLHRIRIVSMPVMRVALSQNVHIVRNPASCVAGEGRTLRFPKIM
jgi:hypothetical protein